MNAWNVEKNFRQNGEIFVVAKISVKFWQISPLRFSEEVESVPPHVNKLKQDR